MIMSLGAELANELWNDVDSGSHSVGVAPADTEAVVDIPIRDGTRYKL